MTSQLKEFFDSDVDLVRMQSERQQRLVQAMQTADVDALILSDPLNVQYIADASSLSRPAEPTVALFTADGKRHTFDAPVDAQAAAVSEMAMGTPNPAMASIAELFRTEGCQRIAFDKLSIPDVMALQIGFGHPTNGRIHTGGANIAALARAVKTTDEIECIRRSQYIIELCMEKVREVANPGADYMQLMGAMAGYFSELDPSGEVLTTMLGPAANGAILIWNVGSATPHNAAGEPPFPNPPFPSGPLAAGDVVVVDTTLRYYGLEGDWGRTWVIGEKPSAKLMDQHKRWCAVRDRVADAYRPGNTAADVLAAATAGGESRSWVDHLYLTHGIGLSPAEFPLIGSNPDSWYYQTLVEMGTYPAWHGDPHSGPWPARDEDIVLESGMVLVTEPIIWDPADGAGAYRSEDIYVVSDSGDPKLLSHASYAPFE